MCKEVKKTYWFTTQHAFPCRSLSEPVMDPFSSPCRNLPIRLLFFPPSCSVLYAPDINLDRCFALPPRPSYALRRHIFLFSPHRKKNEQDLLFSFRQKKRGKTVFRGFKFPPPACPSLLLSFPLQLLAEETSLIFWVDIWSVLLRT